MAAVSGSLLASARADATDDSLPVELSSKSYTYHSEHVDVSRQMGIEQSSRVLFTVEVAQVLSQNEGERSAGHRVRQRLPEVVLKVGLEGSVP